MGRIDYNLIKTTLKEKLENYADLDGVKIGIEEDVAFSVMDPFINIDLVRRTAPDGEQTMSGGTKTNYLLHLRYSVWSAAFEKSAAIKTRDDLMGYLEIALTSDRKLTTIDNIELFETSWITGGDLIAEGIEENTFVAYGLVDQVARVSMTI